MKEAADGSHQGACHEASSPAGLPTRLGFDASSSPFPGPGSRDGMLPCREGSGGKGLGDGPVRGAQGVEWHAGRPFGPMHVLAMWSSRQSCLRAAREDGGTR